MNLRQALAALRARWRVALGVFGVLVAAAVTAGLWQPRLFAASASVVLDSRPDAVSAQAQGAPSGSAFLATQADIARSERVAARAATLLLPEHGATLRARWQAAGPGAPAFERWLAGLVREALQVRPARDSNVLAIVARAEDPALAAALANAAMRAYLDVTLELRVDPARRFSAFFEQQAREARAQLEDAQARLSAWRKAHGIVAGDDRLDAENARLVELAGQLAAVQSQAADSSSRRVQAQGERADRLQEVIANPLVSQLRAEIGRNEAQLQQLATRLGDNHPQLVELRAQIAEQTSRLQAETSRVAGGVGVADSINRRREAELAGTLAAQRSQVLRLQAARDEARLLQREVDAAQRAWEAIEQRLAQASLESATPQSHARELAAAQVPLEPAGPGLALHTLLSALLAAGVAGALVLGLEWRDRRVRSAADAVEALALPLLGVLPAGGPSRPAAPALPGGRPALSRSGA